MLQLYSKLLDIEAYLRVFNLQQFLGITFRLTSHPISFPKMIGWNVHRLTTNHMSLVSTPFILKEKRGNLADITGKMTNLTGEA